MSKTTDNRALILKLEMEYTEAVRLHLPHVAADRKRRLTKELKRLNDNESDKSK